MPKAHSSLPRRTDTVAGVFATDSADPFSMYTTTNAYAHDLKQPLRAGFQQKEQLGGFARNHEDVIGASEVEGGAFGRSSAKRGPKYNAQIDDPAHDRHTSVNRAAYGNAPATTTTTTTTIMPHAAEEEAEMAAAIAVHRRKRQATGFSSNAPPIVGDDGSQQPNHKPELVRRRMGTKDPISRENDWAGPAQMSTTSRAAYGGPQAEAVTDWSQMERHRPRNAGVARNAAPTNIFGAEEGGGPAPTSESRSRFVDHGFLSESAVPDAYGESRTVRHAAQAHQAQSTVLPSRTANPITDAYPQQLTELAEQNLRRRNPVEYDVYKNPEQWHTTSRRAFGSDTTHASPNPAEVLDRNRAVQSMAPAISDPGTAVRVMAGKRGPAPSGYGNNTLPPMALGDDGDGGSRRSVYQGAYRPPLDLPPVGGPSKLTTGFVSGAHDHRAVF